VESLSLTRSDWALVSHELGRADSSATPAGLRTRIDALLADIPRGWVVEECSLELDSASAAVVRAILRRAYGQLRDPGLAQAQADAVAAADDIVRGHHPPDGSLP
jgi:hypothetical protein